MSDSIPLREDLHPLKGVVQVRCLACGDRLVLPKDLRFDLPDITCGRCGTQGELAIELEENEPPDL